MSRAAGDGDRPVGIAGESVRTPKTARWPFALFLLLALAFCADGLRPGRVFTPTNPTVFEPWVDDPQVGEPGGASNSLMADALVFTLPGRLWNHEMFSRGELPLWNPLVFSGYPHLALIQENALYPLSAPLDAFAPLAGIGWSAVLHLALAGALMHVFLRRLGLDEVSAAVGGIAFELNGMFLVRVSAPSYVYSGTWLPLLLLGALSIARGRRPVAVAAVLGTTLSVLGGHPQITALALALAGAFLLAAVRDAGPEGSAPGRRLVGAAAAFGASVLLGVAIAGVQVVPFLELMANSARSAISLAAYRASAVPPFGLLQALVPDIFGNPVERDYWFTGAAGMLDGIRSVDRFWAPNYSGANVFTGVAPLVLAGLALVRSPRRRLVVFFSLASAVAIGVFVGSPLLDLAYVAMPGFRHSRPDRILFVHMAAVAVLAALGAETIAGVTPGMDGALRRSFPRQAAALTAVWLGVATWPVPARLATMDGREGIATWVALAVSRWREDAAIVGPQGVAALLVLLGVLATSAAGRSTPGLARVAGLACAALVALPCLVFGWHFNPSQSTPSFGASEFERLVVREAGNGRVARVLREGGEGRVTRVPREAGDGRVTRVPREAAQFLPANVSQVLGLRDVHGASAAGVAPYLALVDAAEPGCVAKQKYFRKFGNGAVAQTRLLDLLGVTLLLSNEDPGDGFERIGNRGDVALYRNRRSLPRFRMVGRWEEVADDDDARRRLLDRGFDAEGLVLLDRGPAAAAGLPLASPAAVGDARVVIDRDDPSLIELRVDAPGGGMLVVADTFYPGWEARIDGQRAEILRANTAFRAVAMPAGSHRVEMAFRPRSLRAGLATSVAALVAFFGLLAIGRRTGSENRGAVSR